MTDPIVDTPILTSDISDQVTSPVLQPPQPKQSNTFLTILLGCIVLIVVGAGAYYLGMQRNQPLLVSTPSTDEVSKTNNLPTVSPTSIVTTPVASVSPTTNIPAGWTMMESPICHIQVPLPPKKAPYYIPRDSSASGVNDIGNWWRLTENDAGDYQKFFTHQTIITLSNPDDMGSGYISGLVNIDCGANSKNYTTQSFVDAYAKQFTDGSFSALQFQSEGSVSLWNMTVLKGKVSGGMRDENYYYFVATPSTLYMIHTLSDSQDAFVQRTTKQIFDAIQFTK